VLPPFAAKCSISGAPPDGSRRLTGTPRRRASSFMVSRRGRALIARLRMQQGKVAPSHQHDDKVVFQFEVLFVS